MAKLVSGRTKKVPQSQLTEDRYQFLGLDQAEPDLGDPLVGPSSIGAKPFPPGDAYVLTSFGGTETSPSRFWILTSSIPGLGVLPGAVSIRDEGTLVGSANSFYSLNFVGDPVSIDYVGPLASEQTGIATIRISPVAYGSTGEFQYKNSSGLLSGVTDFKYYSSTGNVGFGTTNAIDKLHIEGNIRTKNLYARQELSGSFILPITEDLNNFSIIGRLRSGYANFGRVDVIGDLQIYNKLFASNGRGNTGEVLTSQGSSGPAIWAPAVDVTVGSANSIFVNNNPFDQNYHILFTEQLSSDIGTLNVDLNSLVYNPVSNYLGLGTTLPEQTLHVVGNSIITGISTLNDLESSNINVQNITGTAGTITTFDSTNGSITNLIGTAATITTFDSTNGSIANLTGTAGTITTFDSTNGSITNIIGTAGTITTFDSTNGSITNLIGTAATITTFDNINGTITNLTGTAGTITNFNSTNGSITNLTGTSGTITNFNSTNGSITNLTGTAGTITNFNSTNGTINNLEIINLNSSGVATFSNRVHVSGNIGIGTTLPDKKLHLVGDSKFYGTVNLETSVTESVSSSTGFSSIFSVSPSGVLNIDVSKSTISVGILTTSISSWNFTGVSTENSKATTITIIADSSSLITYGEACSVNGQLISGGVRWNGGIAPLPTDNEDIISFAIVRDIQGTIRVYGSVSLNFS